MNFAINAQMWKTNKLINLRPNLLIHVIMLKDISDPMISLSPALSIAFVFSHSLVRLIPTVPLNPIVLLGLMIPFVHMFHRALSFHCSIESHGLIRFNHPIWLIDPTDCTRDIKNPIILLGLFVCIKSCSRMIHQLICLIGSNNPC